MTEPTRAPRGISTGRAAQLLGVSRRSVWRIVRSGALPAWRLGDRGPWHVRIEDVRALVRQNSPAR